MAHLKEQINLTEKFTEKDQTLDMLDKDLKKTVLNMIKELKENKHKELKKSRKLHKDKIRISIEIENLLNRNNGAESVII